MSAATVRAVEPRPREIVVDQLNGVSAVRHAHLVGLHEEARRLAGLIERFRISWVLGELSAEADRLVNASA